MYTVIFEHFHLHDILINSLPDFSHTILVPRAFWPVAGIKSSGSNHFEITKEITKFCPAGFTAQSASMAHAWNGCSQSSHFPTAGQGERDCFHTDEYARFISLSLARKERKAAIDVVNCEVTGLSPNSQATLPIIYEEPVFSEFFRKSLTGPSKLVKNLSKEPTCE